MNALLLEKLTLFREQRGFDTAKVLIAQKIKYQYAVIKKKEPAFLFLKKVTEAKTFNELLLVEARAAKEYWKHYGANIASRVVWNSREPHAHDVCNKMLDIGYNYLSAYLAKLFLVLNIPTELGLFHSGRYPKS